MNSNKSNEKYDLIENFFKIKSDSMSDYFTKMINVWKADTKKNNNFCTSIRSSCSVPAVVAPVPTLEVVTSVQEVAASGLEVDSAAIATPVTQNQYQFQ